MPKNIGSSLLSLIQSGNFQDFDCYTITTKSGPILRYTTADFDITDGANVWDAHSVRVGDFGTSARAHWKVGLDVDTWQALFQPRNSDPITGASFPDTIGSVGWIAAAQAGALDDAVLTISRAYFQNPLTFPVTGIAQPTGFVVIFEGPTTEIDCGSTSAIVNAESWAGYLQRSIPRNLWQTNCIHNLFDVGCTLSRASFGKAGSVTSASGNTINSSIAAPSGSGTYTLGAITMTSGLNSGFSRQVTSWTSGTFTLRRPFPYTVSPGDTFTAYPGCDKTKATCNLFSNILNYGGETDIPVPETAA